MGGGEHVGFGADYDEGPLGTEGFDLGEVEQEG